MSTDASHFAADLYSDLKALARNYLDVERTGHTLQPTALVHEAYIKLAGQNRVTWQSRTHFLAVAATTMRRVLVDYARGHNRQKRGAGWCRVTLDEACQSFEQNNIEVIEFDGVLSRYESVDPRASKVVECRIFGGLTNLEIADLLKVSEKTVQNDWVAARAWLATQLDHSSS